MKSSLFVHEIPRKSNDLLDKSALLGGGLQREAIKNGIHLKSFIASTHCQILKRHITGGTELVNGVMMSISGTTSERSPSWTYTLSRHIER